MKAAIPFPDISSELFSITIFGFELALRWYALAYIVGIIIGWRLVVMAVNRPHLWPDNTAPMTIKQVEDLATWVILGVILGGRLGYVVFYQPSYYLQNPGEILMLWEGGMSFHGGLLGVIAACVIYSWRQGIRWLSVADILCVVTPVGLLLGRIANFTNAELWGRPTELPWGVIFPGQLAQNCLGIVPGFCARHPSQLYEAALEGFLLGAILLYLVFRRGLLKKIGAATGIFFAGYGVGRFIVEFVRQPDETFQSPGNPLGLALHLNGYGLTMGQILCIPMILFGLYMVVHAQRMVAQTAG